MTRSTGKRRPHYKDTLPADPAVKRYGEWPAYNQVFLQQFRQWLRAGGYEGSSLTTYGVAARTAIGFLDKPYWKIEPEADLQQVRAHLETRPLAAQTRRLYHNGLDKFAEYLCQRLRRPAPEKAVNWAYYVGALPTWLAEAVRAYVQHGLRTRRPEDHHRAQLEMLSHFTDVLRWWVARNVLHDLTDITPQRWFEFVEAELARGIQPVTINLRFGRLLGFLRFLQEQGQPICERMLLVKPLDQAQRLPRDVPAEQLRRLAEAIEAETQAAHATPRRLALMDRAWFCLMLYSGLRTGEVRRLKLGEVDWENRRVRIEQSKGLKDRFVYLSAPTLDALKAYLAVRGPAEALPNNLFIHRHQRLGPRYCQVRLRHYGGQCGVKVTPHQLRHSCATLLLNAGAPLLTVQTLLGHCHIQTTLGYARLYDGTVAADYYQAMAQVEKHLQLPESQAIAPPTPGELVALVDALRRGTLNETQTATVRALRAGILALAEQAAGPTTNNHAQPL